MAGTAAAQFSDSLRQQLDRLSSSLSGSSTAIRVWRDLLTEKDRKRLQMEVDKQPRIPGLDDVKFLDMPTDDFELRDGSAGRQLYRCFRRWGAVGMWMRLKGLPRPVAIVDLAYEFGLLHDSVRQRLLKSLGTRPRRRTPSKLLIWNSEEKILQFEGVIIRRISSPGGAKNIELILDCFQASGWQSPIPDPLNAGSKTLNDAISSLNKRLKKIDFHVCNNGQCISWRRCRAPSHVRGTSVRRTGRHG